MGFNWADALDLESCLHEDERMVRDEVRKYCQEKLQPRVLMANREEHFDKEIMREMGALGLARCAVFSLSFGNLPPADFACVCLCRYRSLPPSAGGMGMLGATIGEEFGCPGVNYVTYGLMAREVERCAPCSCISLALVPARLALVPARLLLWLLIPS